MRDPYGIPGLSGRRSPVDAATAGLIFTIGHSTRSIAEFVGVLRAHRVQRVIDIRAIPRSRHNPQFGRERLSPALRRARIHYRRIAGLGGFRRARRDSRNTGWRNASFRGYADYMQTPAFEASLDRCIALANRERTVLMCAEAVPWRCHRSLVADALLVRGLRVSEIVNRMRTRPHTLTSWAHVDGVDITYPPGSQAAKKGMRHRESRNKRTGKNRPGHTQDSD